MNGPFDVFTFGRMAVIQDPTGAVFSIWEARDHSGIGIESQAGALCWADLSTTDPDTAAKFYSELFGWTLSPGAEGYLHIKYGEAFIGGIPPAIHHPQNVPAHWLIYIQVEDCRASTDKATALGARVFVEPMTIKGAGEMSVLGDPQSAVFALFQPVSRN